MKPKLAVFSYVLVCLWFVHKKHPFTIRVLFIFVNPYEFVLMQFVQSRNGKIKDT